MGDLKLFLWRLLCALVRSLFLRPDAMFDYERMYSKRLKICTLCKSIDLRYSKTPPSRPSFWLK